jgi:hypothetical protein
MLKPLSSQEEPITWLLVLFVLNLRRKSITQIYAFCFIHQLGLNYNWSLINGSLWFVFSCNTSLLLRSSSDRRITIPRVSTLTDFNTHVYCHGMAKQLSLLDSNSGELSIEDGNERCKLFLIKEAFLLSGGDK